MELLNMSNKELEIFFNKYNILELDAFKVIMQYVFVYKKESLNEILDYIQNNKKYNDIIDTSKKENFSLSDIKNKNGILSDKELMFLYKIIFDVSNCLDSIKHIDVEYESREVSDIESSLYEEMEKRNIYEKTLML